VTNAAQHTDTRPTDLHLLMCPAGDIMIVVQDQDQDAHPIPTPTYPCAGPDAQSESGRGLALMHALTRAAPHHDCGPGRGQGPDLIGRDFTAGEPNTKYVGDITYLPVDGGKFLYPATVIDLASRRLAGRAIADHMRTELATDALTAAERTRGNLAGAILHTDHGAQHGLNQSSQHQLPGGIVGAR
jgi:transposase InsO family protein